MLDCVHDFDKTLTHMCHDDKRIFHSCTWNKKEKSIVITCRSETNLFYQPVYKGIVYPHTLVLFFSGAMAYRYSTVCRPNNGPNCITILNDEHHMEWLVNSDQHSNIGPSLLTFNSTWKSCMCSYAINGKTISVEEFTRRYLFTHLEQYQIPSEDDVMALAKTWLHHETAFGAGGDPEMYVFHQEQKDQIRDWKRLNDKLWKHFQSNS